MHSTTCPFCGKTYIPKRPDQKSCASRGCAIKARTKGIRQAFGSKELVCPRCGVNFWPNKRGKKAQKYCVDCGRKAQREALTARHRINREAKGLTKENLERLLLHERKTAYEIAREMSVSSTMVYNAMRDHGLLPSENEAVKEVGVEAKRRAATGWSPQAKAEAKKAKSRAMKKQWSDADFRRLMSKRISEAQQEYWRGRRTPKHQRRLSDSIRSMVYQALKEKKSNHSWQELLGYTIHDLMQHLETQFADGMSWSNYGSEWHVDHIIPRASFRFESYHDLEFHRCWALENLQPLWGPENLRKGAKLVRPHQVGLPLRLVE